MAFELKNYQRDCIGAIKDYFRESLKLGAKVAFIEHTDRPYNSVAQLPGLPYVCVRIPTGGGKTSVAASAIAPVIDIWLNQDRAVVLWLAPSNTIVQQTLDALRTPTHPYRQILDQTLKSSVKIMDMSEALWVQPSELDTDTVVIVSTLASLRVEDVENRKIYESSGALQGHFIDLSDDELKSIDDSYSAGDAFKYSLANVLSMRRPIVIVDEAHNARTGLSFDSLARFRPSCILEFTATPDQRQNPSNVLFQVSASELKAEHMIKLPVRLQTKEDWREALAAAIAKQSELETLARQERVKSGKYIRPIVLIQAQPKSTTHETTNFEVVREALVNEFEIPEEFVAVATGEVRELDGINVLDENCQIRFIITVAALREGWDCPFAYILCSVGTLASSTAVEQLLGRILRLPYAEELNYEDLNRCYAFAASSRFAESAKALTDALVESGFERFEASKFVEPAARPSMPKAGLFTPTMRVSVSEAPNLSQLSSSLAARVKYDEKRKELVYDGPSLQPAEVEEIQKCLQLDADKQSVQSEAANFNHAISIPSERGEIFRVPALCITVDGHQEVFEDQFQVLQPLQGCECTLSEAEFSADGSFAEVSEIDISEAGKIAYRFIEQMQKDVHAFDFYGPQNVAELAVWLDRQTDNAEIPQTDSRAYVMRVLKALVEQRGYSIELLIAMRFRLKRALAAKIQKCLQGARSAAYHETLNGGNIVVTPGCFLEFLPSEYPAPAFYNGKVQFQKHYYDMPAAMNEEEAACAAFIDSLPEVEFWVRNLESGGFGFWLQTETDKFYPDFIAKLTDGRFLAVEYKGQRDLDSADTKEKDALGQLWQNRSGDKCRFVLCGAKSFATMIPNALRNA